MNTTSSTHRSEWFYLSLIAIPLILLVALFTAGKVRETLAADDVKAMLAKWTREEETDRHELVFRLDERTGVR